MKQPLFRLIAAIALILGAQSGQGATDYLREIAQLYNSGRAEAAYNLAGQHLLEAEGDPTFDFYYGLAAIDSGHLSQGVFALERMLLSQPANQRVRLELARGYFLLEQYDRARKEFRKVLDTQPPEKVRANIQQFLDLIRLRESRYRTTAGYYVELSTGYDSNVNSAPSIAGFDSPVFGPGVLDNSAVSQEDGYAGFEVGANIIHPLKPGLALFGNLSFSRRAHEEATEFDTRIFNTQGGISLLQGPDRYRLSLQWQKYHVGHRRYRDLLGISGEWQHNLDERTRLTSFLQYTETNFTQNELQGADQAMGGLGIMRSFPLCWQPLFFATLYLGEDRARVDSWAARAIVDRDIYGLSAGTQLTLTPKLSLTLSAQLQESRYDEEDRFFLLQREEEMRKLSLQSTWLLRPHWSLGAKAAYTENQSNISINRYHRTEAGVTLRYEY
jgi:hypothetical protein